MQESSKARILAKLVEARIGGDIEDGLAAAAVQIVVEPTNRLIEITQVGVACRYGIHSVAGADSGPQPKVEYVENVHWSQEADGSETVAYDAATFGSSNLDRGSRQELSIGTIRASISFTSSFSNRLPAIR